jgi:hypothetical protein
MSPMAWLLGVLTSPLWLGWLYLPWGPWRGLWRVAATGELTRIVLI